MWHSLHCGYYSTRYTVCFGESTSNASSRCCCCPGWYFVESIVDIIRIMFSDYLQVRYHDLDFYCELGSYGRLVYRNLALLIHSISLFFDIPVKVILIKLIMEQ